MAKLKIRYFIEKKGKNGSRYYWQPSQSLRIFGFKITRLSDDFAKALTEAEKLNAQLDAWKIAGGEIDLFSKTNFKSQPGTVEAIIDIYKTDHSFKKLAPRTKESYEYSLNIIAQNFKNVPVKAVTRRVVQEFYKKLSNYPAKANAVLRVFRIIMQHAVNEGWIDLNPASKPRLISNPPRQAVWTPEAIGKIITAADEAGKPSIGTAVLLAAYIGQRQGDILKLSWTAYKDGCFTLRQNKTKRWVEIPAHPVLKARLDATPKTATTIITCETTGNPYLTRHFQNTFAKIRKETAKTCPNLHDVWFMDLRRTAVVRLAEAGATEAQIAAVTGHQIETTRKILETYLPRTGTMAAAAIMKLTDYNNQSASLTSSKV